MITLFRRLVSDCALLFRTPPRWLPVAVCSSVLAVIPARADSKFFAPGLQSAESGDFYGVSSWRDSNGVYTTPPVVTDNAKINAFVGQNSSTIAFSLPATSAALTVYGEAVFNLGGNSYILPGLTQLTAGSANPVLSLALNGGTLSTNSFIISSAGGATTVASDAALQVTNTSGSVYSLALISTSTLTVNGAFTSSGGPVSVGLNPGGAVFTLSGATATGSATDVRLGDSAGAAARINITNGASLSVSNGGAGFFRVGFGGAGTLDINSGGRLSVDNQLIFANNVGATGTVTVDGANSKITLTSTANPLYVGLSGTGTLEVKNGGAVSTGLLSLGRYTGGTGTVTLDGNGSKIDVTVNTAGSTRVGRDGNGTLLIRNGGKMTATILEIGYSTGTTGNVTVTGSGSTLVASNAIGVGGSTSAKGGTGTLTVADSGLFSTTNTLKVWNGSTLTLDNGTVKATGGFTFTGSNVKGTGTIDGNVNSTGTTYAPGASPGLLTITGWLTLSSTDTLNMEIGGSAPSLFDRFSVGGVVTLGNATLNLSLLAGFESNAAVNDTLTLIDNTGASGINGKFANVAEGASIVVGNVTFTASYVGGTGNDFVLKVTQLPQPASPPQITAIERVGANIQITFPSVSGKSYRVEYRNDLLTGTWQTLEDKTGTGDPILVIDPNALSLDKRFYRLFLLP